ncbi:class A beta-lactamase [Streptomyces venezuelae]|uniref:Class A beta-lactamase n=1 Tax=Streptomyces venezuelae TaxID=54571 RepID=A0A5P2BVL4_STRVZ|nr:class A beta-lactamase [Streptomyces venezuelae]QES33980.1 class A beta-lactamase [Streptomyces venezuelae]
MSLAQPGTSRRALLLAAALLPLPACGSGDGPAPRKSTAGPPSTPAADPSRLASRFTALERKHGGRLGVYALATGTGATLTHRADERFAFCSTFKTLAAAAVVHHRPLDQLDKRVTYTAADVDSISPVTEKHIATGMTVGELCDAAIRYSDGTAGNLLMREIGGPAGLTDYLRGLGDKVSRMDDHEPELNDVPPGDPRDTTTPRAVAADYRALVLGAALPDAKRALLAGWLGRNATEVGARRIRAGVPKGWRVADKTGTGNWGRANDIAVVRPPDADPLVLAVMTDRPGRDTPPVNAFIAEAAKLVVAELT